jgi:hypothetical protein
VCSRGGGVADGDSVDADAVVVLVLVGMACGFAPLLAQAVVVNADARATMRSA